LVFIGIIAGYYLAVPLDDSVDNNCILVYNFILKNWNLLYIPCWF
jgi:hypothetical protein